MDMSQIMEQAQQFQKRMAEMQDDMASKEMVATVGGGMVEARVNGKNQLLSIKIDKEVIDPEDPKMLEDLIVAAVNEAMKKAQTEAQGEMSKLTGGMNIPGLSNMLGK